MLGFVLALHQLMVWLIVLAGLVCVANATSGATPGSAPGSEPTGATGAPAKAFSVAQFLDAERIREYFRYALLVTAGLGALQAVFGGLLLLMGQRPADALHYVYGGIVLLAIPVAYAYSGEAPAGSPSGTANVLRDQNGHLRREVIIYTIAALAVAAAAIRAWMTGAGIAH
jgi:heme A synthase